MTPDTTPPVTPTGADSSDVALAARRRLTRIGFAAVGLVALTVSATFAFTVADHDHDRLVYVSGRDDHGYLAAQTVTVHREPDGPAAGQVTDGTVARVGATRGTWLHVTPVDGQPGGWIDDFHLRGRLHLVDPEAPGCAVTMAQAPGGAPAYQLPPSTQVELLETATVGDRLWVGVRPGPGYAVSWAPRALLSEIAGPDPRGAADVGCDDLDWPEPPPHEH